MRMFWVNGESGGRIVRHRVSFVCYTVETSHLGINQRSKTWSIGIDGGGPRIQVVRRGARGHSRVV